MINNFTNETEFCPCDPEEELDDVEDTEAWKIAYTCIVLLCMFVALVSDRIGADHIMLAAVTCFMAAEIISIQEGLAGFSNQGLLTVLVLFVVAEGISKTGALDWYMTKLLGAPKTVASAQLRLMIPIATVSAFLNNTPVVAVMIPIVQRWAKNNRLSKQQLLIPLSFASILGGTCTLIGTSTNLVVQGLLSERYEGELSIGLFDLGLYGVPVAMAGLAYVLVSSPFLLPGAGEGSSEDPDAILLGARLSPWSPAAGRTVQRSGLRDSGGIFLVSVYRAATGNVHRAVSRDFVLNVGDTLYFTGLVEGFGEFCEEHGLEMVTSDSVPESAQTTEPEISIEFSRTPLTPVQEEEGAASPDDLTGLQVGVTKESLLKADEEERLRSIHQMTDIIRGSKHGTNMELQGAPAKIVVSMDNDLVVVGINAKDRPGLLLDISKGLLGLRLELRHTEAAVVLDRSLSIWRTEAMQADEIPDLEQIWSVLNALLSTESGVVKQRGLRVIRAKVRKGSRLEGKVATEIDFKTLYNAALVGERKGRFKEGDTLILQANEKSPLLVTPPEDFFKKLKEGSASRSNSVASLVNLVSRLGNRSSNDLESMGQSNGGESRLLPPSHSADAGDDFFIPDGEDTSHGEIEIEPSVGRTSTVEVQENAWKDLQVITAETGETREFLTAMSIPKSSKFVGRTVSNIGIDKLPDLHLVTIDRPSNSKIVVQTGVSGMNDALSQSEASESMVLAITPEDPLEEGDILWFSGSAAAVGDLRKIPGLQSYESDEVGKIEDKVFDRRLVQAVVARKGVLVGKTVKDLRFRSRYGAAVIAVHREGQRVHEHPGKVKLQAGDVLLLEAGPSFISKSAENDKSFALLAEVEDSAPPRLTLLIPALFITATMLAVFTGGVTELLICGLIASFLMVALGIISEQEARNAVNWEVYITIAAAFGIGTALVRSGVAEIVADFLVDVGTGIGIGDAGLYGAVYFATFLISNVVTNNAAAALLFPIAMDAAETTGADRILMSYALMLGASASFMSPFGYTTNLLIYGPGGYKYNDFLIFGTPMQVVLWILSTTFLAFSGMWYVSWLGTFSALAAVVGIRVFSGSTPKSELANKQ